MRVIGFFQLFSNTVRLLKKDPFIFVPTLVFMFLEALFETKFQIGGNSNRFLPVAYVPVIYVMNLFISGLAVLMASESYFGHTPVHFKNCVLTLSKRFWHLVLGTIWYLPLLIYFTKGLLVLDPGKPVPGPLALASLAVLVLGGLILFFLSTVLVDNLPFWKALLRAIVFLFKNWVLALIFAVMSMTVLFGFVLILGFCLRVPLIGESILSVCVQAVSFTFLCAMSVVAYTVGRQVDTQV